MPSYAPLVSVVMSVYNGERFLRAAIDSILDQTFTNFEFIIINDGSTDKTLDIIKSYKDSRILLINQDNQGLIDSLNTGIARAKGTYIARMDADDLSLPNRLESQLRYLRTNPNCDVLSTRIQLIDENGYADGIWPEDEAATTDEEIRQLMPYESCIAHPAIMAKTDVLKSHPFHTEQFATEDYELWLRLLSENKVISKLPEPLYLYRVHSQSVTQIQNAISVDRKVIRSQYLFLKGQIRGGTFGPIESAVLRAIMLRTARHYLERPVKRFLKWPLRKIVNIFDLWFAKKKLDKSVPLQVGGKNRLLFALPWMNIGGADKLLFDLASVLKDNGYDVMFITTNRSDNPWEGKFASLGTVWHIPQFARFVANFPLLIERLVLRTRPNVIIISNAEIAYRALPAIKKQLPSIKAIDVLHGQGGNKENGNAPRFMQPFESYLDRHITVTSYLKEYLISKYGNSPEKIIPILNGVDKSSFNPKEVVSGHYKKKFGIAKDAFVISWIGRVAYEKHPELFMEICHNFSPKPDRQVAFIMAGDGPLMNGVKQRAEMLGLDNLFFTGYINDPARLLADSDALVLSSEMEGMPITLLEAMAMGVIPISTNVGGIPELIVDKETGYLLKYNNDFAPQALGIIAGLANNAALTQKISQACQRRIDQKFTIKLMASRYLEVLADIMK